jgi:hypothetical protein
MPQPPSAVSWVRWPGSRCKPFGSDCPARCPGHCNRAPDSGVGALPVGCRWVFRLPTRRPWTRQPPPSGRLPSFSTSTWDQLTGRARLQRLGAAAARSRCISRGTECRVNTLCTVDGNSRNRPAMPAGPTVWHPQVQLPCAFDRRRCAPRALVRAAGSGRPSRPGRLAGTGQPTVWRRCGRPGIGGWPRRSSPSVIGLRGR